MVRAQEVGIKIGDILEKNLQQKNSGLKNLIVFML